MDTENLRAKSLDYDSRIISGDQIEGLHQLNVSQVVSSSKRQNAHVLGNNHERALRN